MERLNKKEIEKHLGKEIIFFDKINSTFDVEEDTIVAASQTKGQGRLSRSFYSPKGGIYFCIRWPILPLLTISAAAGVMLALESRGLKPKVKWVNDILLDGKKVCGILCKSKNNFATIGVGINYAIKKFPKEIQNKAGTIFQKTDGINKFTADVILSIFDSIKDSQKSLEFYRQRLAGLHKEFTLPDGKKAIIVGIDNDGSLIYEQQGRQDRLIYGDIVL